MVVCATCAHENREGAKFCEQCAAPLATATAREARKTVTVVFCDVTGSTALGESTDPEALRALLARYFARMRGIVEAHGGTVEKFIGDAVMAVFGVPVVHEDDALRACRAAVEMREALPELGVQARIGVNTGEVVTGTAERLATGDAINVAARLEGAARPGEILIGEETHRLVRGAVDAEAVEPLQVKGKREPLPAHRLLTVTDRPERQFATPLVGRERELRALEKAFSRAQHDRSCQLFTVLGAAGVGKSRLAAEFRRNLDARVVKGRCLSYGDGITYWPVVEVVKQLDALPNDPSAAGAIRSLLGETDALATSEEIAWAFRKLLEEQAQQRPLVCFFDDIHWGEQTFLDLVEHVADLSRDAPILLLCLARPELLEKRPAWGGGKWNATTVLLDSLTREESDRLIDALGGTDAALRERIRAAAEGNPLFLEEMLALVRDSGDGEVEVPPTIQALLAARLDQLDPAERSVLERGSVEGRVFHRGAVHALCDNDSQLPHRLVALVRKELVRPDKPQLPGDEAYRFRHLLIRDAAYDALPKTIRADLHQRFANWLQHHGPDLVELDEILGHHLEQAANYKHELGQPDPTLAERAGTHLATAGRKALWRGDSRAAYALLERALALSRDTRLDVHLEIDLSRAASVDLPQATAVVESAEERAHAAGDAAGEALAGVLAALYRSLSAGASAGVDELDRRVRATLPLLQAAGDDRGLAEVWWAFGFGVANHRGRWHEAAEAAENARHHARRAGVWPGSLFGLALALTHGPRPADEALRALEAAAPATPHPGPALTRAHLLAMLGRFDEAWPLAVEAGARLLELSGESTADLVLANIAELAGETDRAAELLRSQCDLFERVGYLNALSTYAPKLGRLLCALDDYDEAERLARLGHELAQEDDVVTQMLWRQALALVLASRGAHDEAERLAREAVAIAQDTDGLNYQADAFADLAGVLLAAGRGDGAVDALGQALERYERKKNWAMARRARARLAELQPA